MNEADINAVNSLGEAVNTYGFLIIFGVLMLGVVVIVIKTMLKTWDADRKAEAEKSKVELSLMEKEQLAQIDQQKQLFDLVTSVQSSQIAQMHEISEVIRIMKDELQNNTMTSIETNVHMNTLNASVTIMMEKYQYVLDYINKLEDEINNTDKKTDEIIASLDEVKSVLNELQSMVRENK